MNSVPERVCAVVVTFNRLGLLQLCLEAVRKQARAADCILVVDNGSEDGTREWLTSQRDVWVVRQANGGSAGGQATGIRWAFERGFGWIWCMDDDGEPAPACLGRLLAVGSGGFDYVAPNLRSREGQWHFDGCFKNSRTEVIGFAGGPFNGILLSRTLVAAVGFPMRQFFIWGDESEYVNRIVEAGFPVVTVRDAIHVHPLTRVDFRGCTRGFYYVRNRFYCARMFRGVYRSKVAYLAGTGLHTARFLGGVVAAGNLGQVGAALWGAVRGCVDSLEAAKEECCWWGVSPNAGGEGSPGKVG